MTAADEKPSYNAGRRIRWLAVAIMALVAAYSGGWYWYAGQVDRAIAAHAGPGDGRAAELACDGRRVRGYPFRIGVFCDRVAYSDPVAGYAVETGAVRSAAQIYNPRRVLAEIDAPVDIARSASGDTYRLDWTRGRASVITVPADARMASFVADEATLALNGAPPIARAERMEAHIRERDGALDIAARPRGLTLDPGLIGERALPEIGVDLDVRLKDWRGGWASDAPAGDGIVNRLSLLLAEDTGIIVQGPFSLSPRGLVNGTFDVRVVDVPGVLASLGPAFPQAAPQIAALGGSARPAEGQPEDELSLRLTLRDSRIFAGFIPLGSLPPIRLGGS